VNLDFLSSFLEEGDPLADSLDIPQKFPTTRQQTLNTVSDSIKSVGNQPDSNPTNPTKPRQKPETDSKPDICRENVGFVGNVSGSNPTKYLSVTQQGRHFVGLSGDSGVYPDIFQLADLELTPIISTLTEPAYLSLEWGGRLCLSHKINPAATQTDHLEQARAKLERKYEGAVPPINTITLEQREKTLGRVSVALERVPPVCGGCIFHQPHHGASRACSKKNLETHEFFLCDVAGPRGEGLMFKAVGA
jgi:hypothetical protein